MKRLGGLALLSALLIVAFATSCARTVNQSDQDKQEERKALPATVVPVTTRTIVDYAELTGRAAAVESVEVRAQVSGYLESINFKAGTFVHRGDVLFTLDSRVYKAVLAQRESEVAATSADLKRLEADLTRQQGLVERNATSRAQYELALAERDQRAAELESARASVDRARIDLDYASVKSPIDGEVGRELITVGNLVSSGSTLLTRIVSVDPIHIFFDVDERALLAFRKRLATGDDLEVKYAIGDGEFENVAKVDFSEPRMNETTGTLEFRAVAENKLNENGFRALVPGLRLRVLFPTSGEYEAAIVPEEAVVTDQNVKRVYVLTPGNGVESRVVELGPLQEDNMRAILSGVKAGEKVIVDNLLRIRPDSLIDPIEAPAESSTRIIREDGTVVNVDGTKEYDGLYEWSLEEAKEGAKEGETDQGDGDQGDVEAETKADAA